jgi:hypothetical protein
MTRMTKSLLLVLALLCPLLASCVDSDNPLSDPNQSTIDPGLLGVWRLQTKDGDLIYYHVGKAGEKFPAGMLRAITITQNQKGELLRPEPNDTLVFTTTLGNKHFLNITGLSADKIKTMGDSKWESSMADGFFIYKYEIKENKLEVACIDSKQKTETIKSGKIKGTIDGDKVRMTDTTENLAKFFATPDAAKLFFTKASEGEGFATLERLK